MYAKTTNGATHKHTHVLSSHVMQEITEQTLLYEHLAIQVYAGSSSAI